MASVAAAMDLARPAMHAATGLAGLLRRQAAARPLHTAFVFLRDGETACEQLGFAELEAAAGRMAAALARRFRPGERLLLLSDAQGLDFVVAFFACLHAGLLAVPVYPATAGAELARLARIAADCGAAGLLVGRTALAATAAALAASPDLRRLPLLTLHDAAEHGDPPAPTDDNAVAFLQYTSGSTGAPKGVRVSHGNLLANLAAIRSGFGHTERTVGVSWLPLYHDMGLIGHVLQPVFLGVTSVLMPPAAFVAKPVRWLAAISAHGATCSGGPNFAYDLCLRRISDAQMEGLDLSRWAVAFTGAETVRSDTIDRFARRFAACGFRREAFVSCYGMAEATLLVSATAPGHAPAVRALDAGALQAHHVNPAAAGEPTQSVVSCGRPVGAAVEIVDPHTGRPVGEGQVGEIRVCGAGVAQGYWNRPEESAACFSTALDGGPGPWLCTGDLGFLADGELHVTGRVKDLVIIRGRNYYPHDIEAAVRASHPALSGGVGAAFSVDLEGEERLIVVHEVHRHALRRLAADEVLGAARMALMSEFGLTLQELVLLKQGSLPKTSSGKIRRGASREAYLGSRLTAMPGHESRRARRSETLAEPGDMT